MKLLLVLVAVLALACGEVLVWEDNFDELNDAKWGHQITGWDGGNTEFQYYRNNRKNSWVEGGILKIKPTMAIEDHTEGDLYNGYQNEPGCTQEPCTIIANPQGQCIKTVYSARLHTLGKFNFGYGRIEVRAKMPRGDWLWPAIWMMPVGNVYGGWPASGEIDIVETRGNPYIHTDTGVHVGIRNVEHTLHWGPRWPYNGYDKTHYEIIREGSDYADDFHTYELERTADHIIYRIDGAETGRVEPGPHGGFWNWGQFPADTRNPWGSNPMAPFDQQFYLIFNIAVGGNFFDFLKNDPNPAAPWDLYSGRFLCQFHEGRDQFLPTWVSPTLEVDYVRYYQ